MLLVSSSLPAVRRLSVEAINFRDVRPSQSDRSQIAFFRVWCLVELAAALRHARPLVMKCGTANVRRTSGGGASFSFEPDVVMLTKLQWMVQVEKASASVEADRARIIAAVRHDPGSVQLDSAIKGAISGAVEALRRPTLQRCALGEAAALREAVAEAGGAAEALRCAAAGGYVGLLRDIEAGWGGEIDVDEAAAAEDGMAALHHAARSGHAEAVRFLLERLGADVDAQSANGRTAIMYAAELGTLPAVAALLEHAQAPADLELRDDEGMTALMHAQGALAAGSSGCEAVLEALWEAAEAVGLDPSELLC